MKLRHEGRGTFAQGWEKNPKIQECVGTGGGSRQEEREGRRQRGNMGQEAPSSSSMDEQAWQQHSPGASQTLSPLQRPKGGTGEDRGHLEKA